MSTNSQATFCAISFLIFLWIYLTFLRFTRRTAVSVDLFTKACFYSIVEPTSALGTKFVYVSRWLHIAVKTGCPQRPAVTAMWIQWIYIAVKAGLWGKTVFTAIWSLFVFDHILHIFKPYSNLDPTWECLQTKKLTKTEKIRLTPLRNVRKWPHHFTAICSLFILYHSIP